MRVPTAEDHRIRVLRIIARMNVGGPALQVTNLMQNLDDRRFHQALLTGYVDANEADFIDLRAPHLEVQRIQGLGRSPNAVGDVRALVSLMLAVRQFRPHIVHTHTAKAGALGRIAAKAAGRSKIVHTYHGHLLHGYFSPRVTGAVIRTERTLARLSDRLVAVGEQVRDDLLAAGIGRADQYDVVPPGIPLGALPTRDEARRTLGLPTDQAVVMLMARLVPIKRVDRFIDVARRVCDARPDAIFAVAGDGPLAQQLRTAAAPLGDRFRFLGWQSHVETVHAASDVALLCSDNEGMPVSLIEASLAGVAAVTTNVGSAAEVVIDGETGIVTDASAESLAAAVGRLLADDNLRRRMGRAARARATTCFSEARLVTDTQRIYEQLVEDA